MEMHGGKWRYTSPTHVVRAFQEALRELDDEGGVTARHQRYCDNQQQLVDGLAGLGIQALLERRHQSPIITSFLYPADSRFTFEEFYRRMKQKRFVLYPGKVSQAPTFRIGTIGHVFADDIQCLVQCVGEALEEMGISRIASSAQ
jgi:2-aminoethylphosphonate-pyruvate transaminase